jgi:hypothetical protein
MQLNAHDAVSDTSSQIAKRLMFVFRYNGSGFEVCQKVQVNMCNVMAGNGNPWLTRASGIIKPCQES